MGALYLNGSTDEKLVIWKWLDSYLKKAETHGKLIQNATGKGWIFF